jgi:predicted DNA-binding protein (MmcQ/YjbR family)
VTVTRPRARRGPSQLEQLSQLCLALPEAQPDDRHPPHRGFRVAGRNFAWYTENEHGSDRIALCVRAAPQENAALVGSDPERFALPKYVARHGWVNYFLDLPQRPVDWREVTELVHDSYRLQAPGRLARLVGR